MKRTILAALLGILVLDIAYRIAVRQWLRSVIGATANPQPIKWK